jgi:D-alanyl-lipoteichoic acid acyltransferase DltB (MBOAT superfamily)
LLFNSEQYLVFLPIVVAINWALPKLFRPTFLVGASYFFYASWNPPFLFLVFGLTLANYFIGMAQGRRKPRLRRLLVLALIIDLGALAIFKYLGLLDLSAARLVAILGLPATIPGVNLILPLGLSFFTFEFIHYQVDLVRGYEPIVNPIRFALFPAFFPTQIAGPIKRYQAFDKQVRSLPGFDPTLALEGVELIARGLFKKVVLADYLLPFAATVFAAPSDATTLDVIGGLVAFSFQIYLDFSGYTDIGRGSAQLLGYTVPENFDAPYLSTSIRDFWHRWHMSLSSWLRDYLYIPLGGSRKGNTRTYANLMITMALGGRWHGAAWHFLFWGIGQGAALSINRAWQEAKRPAIAIPGWLALVAGWAATQFTVLFLWSLFRAPSETAAISLWESALNISLRRHLLSGANLAIIALIAAMVLGTQIVTRRWNPRELLGSHAAAVFLRPAYAVALMTIAFVAALTQNGAVHKFIYFQF